MTNKLSLYFSEGTTTPGNMEAILGKLDVYTVPLNDKSVNTMYKGDSFTASNNNDSGNDSGLSGGTSPRQVTFQSNNPQSIPASLLSLGEKVKEVACFESRGVSDNKDIWPTGVAVDIDGNIFVLDRDNKKVKMFSRTGKFIREFGQNGVQNLQCPYDLTIMEDGCIAVTDYEDEDVKIYSPLGMYVKSFKANFKYPRGIATNQIGQLLVIDCHSHRLTVHDPDTGTVVREIAGRSDDGCDLFTDPYYICTNRANHIIVTDWSAPNLKFFDGHGNQLNTYGTYGVSKDQVLQPYGVCCDHEGNIFVADNQNHRIHLLAPDGSFLRFMVTKQHGLWHPMALAAHNGQLIVTEALGKIKVFQYM